MSRLVNNALFFYNYEYQKKDNFWFYFPGLISIYRNVNRKEFLSSFEKISVFYFNWPKFWIWRTLGHIMIYLVNVIFIMLQKSILAKRIVEFYARSIVPFWKFFNPGKMALLKFKKQNMMIKRSKQFWAVHWK